MKILHLQGHVAKVETKADRSVKLTITSAKELTNADELAQLFSINDEVVGIGIKVGPITKEELLDIPEPQSDFKNEKSPGQRLRAVIYRLWESKGKQGEFELYYRRHMEKLIDQFKEMIL